ncbi:hypothetical protein [Acinetobacter populi]|uniref:Uncharacterized protein n=1 Tax=Acinetobacter populi TaxID=1582270 RepID=A0A1Z9Z2L6_9GAMM|nr:hypothetical protein [Acinetobacter populi]OUY08723.1 hypothetical protein CAP51_03670 [Acinetobacter populi]
MSINAELDLNAIIEKLLNDTYGLIFLCIIIFLVILTVFVYFIAKSGLISEIKNYLEYRNKSEQDRLKNQNDLLAMASFKPIENELKYHFDIERIQKYLKFKHSDMDLIFYIISCRNKKAAIKYYESSSSCLEKDLITKRYILKKIYKNWVVSTLYWLGTILYFGLVFASLFPTIWVFQIAWTTGENLNDLPNVFFAFQFLLSIIAIVVGLFILSPLLKPWKAKQFLELEKVKD